jgi:hypothetical protein
VQRQPSQAGDQGGCAAEEQGRHHIHLDIVLRCPNFEGRRAQAPRRYLSFKVLLQRAMRF